MENIEINETPPSDSAIPFPWTEKWLKGKTQLTLNS